MHMQINLIIGKRKGDMMQKFTLSVATILAMSTFAVAGGDIAPVEPVVEAVAPSADESGFYVGIAYGMADVEADGTVTYMEGSTVVNGPDDYTYEQEDDAFMLQAGYTINKYFSIEGRYWTSVSDGDWTATTTDNTTVINSSGSDSEFEAWGLYVKPMYPLTEELDLYALLGYGNVTLSDSGGDWFDENSFQWGIGASYALTDNLSLFADYVNMYSDSDHWTEPAAQGFYYDYGVDTDIYTVNVGLTYKF